MRVLQLFHLLGLATARARQSKLRAGAALILSCAGALLPLRGFAGAFTQAYVAVEIGGWHGIWEFVHPVSKSLSMSHDSAAPDVWLALTEAQSDVALGANRVFTSSEYYFGLGLFQPLPNCSAD